MVPPPGAYLKTLGEGEMIAKRERTWFHTAVATSITFLALAAALQLGLLG